MSAPLPPLLQRFFTERLLAQRHASPHTVSAYRDTFRLLLRFARRRCGKAPAALDLADIDATLITAFLGALEVERRATARTRNARLTAIRSFFSFASYQEPALSAHIQQVLAIPYKRQTRPQVAFLTPTELDALVCAPDGTTWHGRRDRVLLALAAQTGLRLSELTALTRADVHLGTGAYVRCDGKGRKERCTPLAPATVALLRRWLDEPAPNASAVLFPNPHGGRLSADSVQHLVRRYAARAATRCPTLNGKRVSPHVLRHSAAMSLLAAGVDSSVIALWLGHESVNTTQIYLHAHLALKEAALARTAPSTVRPARFHPDDRLLAFLNDL